MGRVYSFSFSEVAIVAQQDLFQIEAKIVPVKLHAVFLFQTSDVGDAAAENLSILIRRVTDVVTDDVVEVKMDPGDGVANANLAVNETTELVTGAEIVHAEGWNIAHPYIWEPPKERRITVKIDDTIVVNLNNTPVDSLTVSGTAYFEELGA